MLIDPLIAVRVIHLASTVMAAGVVFFRFLVADPVLSRAGSAAGLDATLDARLTRIVWGSLAVAVLSGCGWLLLLATEMSDRSLAEALSESIIWTVLTNTRFGHVWTARILLAAALAGWLLGSRSASGKFSGLRGSIATALAAALLGSLAFAGHGGATAGTAGAFHLASDSGHLIAAGAWLGGLVPLALVFAVARGAPDQVSAAIARDITLRFSTLGIVSVGTLLATGIANAWFLVGNVPALLGTPYGHLLLVKIALFMAMVAIAAVNRLRLTPRLADNIHNHADAVRRLQRNSLVEAALGLAILGIVGALGTIPPALHVQPWWPLPARIDGETFATPIALAAITAAIAVVIVAIITRRFRLINIAAGIAAAACFGWSVLSALVPAFPTSFYRSPTNFTAASIARGQDLFAAHCAICHGREGRGDGPNAKALDKKPSDLTADHVYGHLDGDLYWWIDHGIDETMPGFASVLDENARWSLIDFIHANADAVRLRRPDARAAEFAFPTPDFTAECPDGSTLSIEQLHGRLVRLVIAGADAAHRSRPAARRDIATIVVALDPAAAENMNVCTVHDPDAGKALAIYRGDAGAIDGTEFLIDTEGRLRSVWHPGRTPDWNDPEAFNRQIELIRQTPAAQRRASSHTHGH